MKSGNLKFLEPSGPFQTCNETSLPLPYNYTLKPTRSGGTEKFTDLSVESNRVLDPWSACKSHFSTVLQVQIRNTRRASVVLPVIKLSRCSGKRKLDTGIKFLLWPTLHQPSACIHHCVACIYVHKPRKDKMVITPRNNIQIRKLHLTTRSTAPLEKQRDAQLFKKLPSFYGTWRSIMEFTIAPPPPMPYGPNYQINTVKKLSLCILNIRFNILLPSTAGLSTDFSSKHSQNHPVRDHFQPHTCHLSCPYFLYFDNTVNIFAEHCRS
jgi:hypothetical protein